MRRRDRRQASYSAAGFAAALESDQAQRVITGGLLLRLAYGLIARHRRLERIEEKLDDVVDEVADEDDDGSTT